MNNVKAVAGFAEFAFFKQHYR